MASKPDSISELVSTFLSSYGSLHGKRSSIVFNDLTVVGGGRGVQIAPTVWSTIQSWGNIFSPKTYRGAQRSRTLLHGFKGTLGAGEMLLVIGKPGSGCTTFLKTLSNMREEYKDTTGVLTYGGRPSDAGDPDPVRLTFCAEEDTHLPTLTVAETLRFAVRSTWNYKTSGDAINTAVETAARCVGLAHVLDTRVGSDKVHGLSGGERRRVSLGEAIATCPDFIALDNPTNGLDSSTALEFVELMREYTMQSGCSTAMSIYQGSNSMIPHFDKVLVINDGRQIFYGPASEAKAYFEDLGFVYSDRITITDFLNSMSAEPKLRHTRPGFENRVPRTALEFETTFRQNQNFKAIDDSIMKENSVEAVVGSKARIYSLPIYLQVMECAKRQFRILITDYNAWAIEASCIIVQSLFLGTLFRDQDRITQSLFVLSCSLFFSVLVPALQSLSEFGNTFAQRDLVIRQKRYRFYRPVSYALGLVITDVVWKILAIAYNIPQYFLVGFQRTAANFFIWFLAVYVEHLALSFIFRAIAVFSPSMGIAALPVAIMFNIFVIYTGFYIPVPAMQNWLFWLRYLNPMNYAYEAIMVNEFGNLEYQCSLQDLVPSGPGYDSVANQVCAVAGSESSRSMVSGAAYIAGQYGFQVSNLWRNIGVNIGLAIFFAICTGIGMERYKLPAGKLATVFYKSQPKDIPDNKDSSSSDTEKALSEEEAPPTNPHEGSDTILKQVATENGRTFQWKNISLEIKVKGGTKKLLHSISGFAKPNNLTALMGISGAGKTTLLNTLSGRLEIGTISGEIFLNGRKLPKSFRRQMGYVPQQDIHLPTQTVREALRMTAMLRGPRDVSIEEKIAYVERVIDVLEMQSISDALIGVPGAGLNLEQRKRVTIGVELSAMPDILFLDEPSSGLDGQSALNIVRLLAKLASSGQTVLCTIHQPAAELMEYFDHLVLLVKGGLVAYNGPLGDKCSTALSYFAQRSRPCERQENPAEYFLDIVGAGSRNESKADWANIWADSTERNEELAQFDESLAKPKEISSSTQADNERTFAASLTFQFKVIMRRTWLFYWRDPEYFVTKLFMNLCNALVNGLTYLNASSSERGMYNRVFSIFVALIVGPPIGLQVEDRFYSLREIFLLREKGSQTYSWIVFVATAILVELPYAMFAGLVYWLLWYYPVGYLTETSRAGYSFLMYELFSIFLVGVSQLCAAVMPNLTSTYAANGFLFLVLNTFTGALIPQPMTPAGWRWFYNVSPLFYFSEGITSSVLEGLEIICGADETSVFQPGNGLSCTDYASQFLQEATGYLLNPNSTENCQYCRYRDGNAYLTQYNWQFSDIYRDVGIFIGFIAFNFTGVIVLTYLTRIYQWRKR